MTGATKTGNGESDMAAELADPALPARLRAGDRSAIQLVVQAYLKQVLRAARGAGLDPSRAEEVTQATFMTFIESAARFEGRSHVRTWLFGILYKKIKEARRGEQRDRRMEELDEAAERRFDADGGWSRRPEAADAAVYASEIRSYLAACLDDLSTPQRSAFVLREVHGFATDEICKILEVSATNLGVLLHRARNRLRECLAAAGVRT